MLPSSDEPDDCLPSKEHYHAPMAPRNPHPFHPKMQVWRYWHIQNFWIDIILVIAELHFFSWPFLHFAIVMCCPTPLLHSWFWDNKLCNLLHHLIGIFWNWLFGIVLWAWCIALILIIPNWVSFMLFEFGSVRHCYVWSLFRTGLCCHSVFPFIRKE